MTVMKSAVLALALVASAAFANLSQIPGEYTSSGTWKSASGQKGKWTSTVSVAKAERGFSVAEKLSVFAPNPAPGAEPIHVKDTAWRAVTTQNGFFDVMTGDEKTGWGFCNAVSCVIQGKGEEPDSTYGETLLVGATALYRTGFDKSAHDTISWEGSAKKRKPN